MEGYQIIKELYQSGRFKHIYLIGGAAANLHILHRGLQISQDLISDFDVEIYSNGNYGSEEVSRVISTMKEILCHHRCQFPEESEYSSITKVKIDGLDFDFFINEIDPERIQIVDGIPVYHVEDLVAEYSRNIIAFEKDIASTRQQYSDEDLSYLEGKRDRYRKRLALLA